MTEKIQQYFDLMRDIEENFITYIGENSQNYNFINYLDKQKIIENKQKFKSFLYLLVNISNNYHRSKDYYSKIDQILTHYQNAIQKFYQNSEIFHIFQSNKRILLFLIQQKLITINQGIFDIFNQKKYLQRSYIEYFYPEIESFIISESVKNEYKDKIIELYDNNLDQFDEKRKIGENDSYLCSLIRNDEVIDFITYLEKNNISPSSLIKPSIYETNHFLLKNNEKVTLIEYSAFFGAQQIFQYLTKQNVELTSDIWLYVIHGKNAEIIHFLEENQVKTLNESYQYLVIESIKCHYIEIADYFLLNFCLKEQIYEQYLLKKYLKYYHFNLVNYNVQQIIQFSIDFDLFYFFCKYDYSFVVELLLSENKININQEYKIYKPYNCKDDIVLSIAIKNGEIDKIPDKDENGLDRRRRNINQSEIDIKPPDFVEYEEGNFYDIYNYDLEILTVLFISVRKGNIEIIELLLKSKNIDAEIKCRKYYKFVYSQMFHEYETIEEKRSLLHDAIESGYVDVVKILSSLIKVNFNDLLIKSGKFIDYHSTAHMRDFDEDHKTSLLLAVELGYSEIFQFLLSQNADIDQKSISVNTSAGGCQFYMETAKRIEKTTLYAAIEKGNLNIVKICLEQPKIDINIPFNDYDLKGYKWWMVSECFSEKPDSICKRISSLYLAVSNSNIDIVRLLLNHPKIDINMKSVLDSKQLRTALHKAVENKQIDIIKLLLQHKNININSLDENQKKPIDYTDDEDIKELFNNVKVSPLTKLLSFFHINL